MKSNSGKIWPYIIGLSIVGIFGACVATVIVASSSPVQGSDLYMRSYHDADANVNELINAQIEFDKKYTIEYKTEKLSMAEAVIAYRITDKLGQAIDNANLEVVVTRPDVHKYDQKLINPTFRDGLYTFSPISLEKEGRWDIMAKVSIGEDSRYYNVKADTRAKEAFEY